MLLLRRSRLSGALITAPLVALSLMTLCATSGQAEAGALPTYRLTLVDGRLDPVELEVVAVLVLVSASCGEGQTEGKQGSAHGVSRAGVGCVPPTIASRMAAVSAPLMATRPCAGRSPRKHPLPSTE